MGILYLHRRSGTREKNSNRGGKSARNPFSIKLRIEPLEDRRLLSVWSNTNLITIPVGAPSNTSGPASPYPSNISVSGLSGTLTDVNVSLYGFTHTYPDDVDVLLVGPAGQKVIVLSDVGGSNGINGVNLTLDDAAASSLPDSGILASGTFKPTDIEAGDSFSSPAPLSPYASTLAAFNGTNPNGTWSLYVIDDASYDYGYFSGGWALTITTNGVGASSWSQTSQTEFASDVLTNTVATTVSGDGQVMLGGGTGSEITGRITNPSFEGPLGDTPTAWTSSLSGNMNEGVRMSSSPATPGMPSDGTYFEALWTWNNYTVAAGDYVSISQSVDLTGVSNLKFDASLWAPGAWLNDVKARVLIDGTEKWSKTSTTAAVFADQSINVSSYSGMHTIQLREDVMTDGAYGSQWVTFDNLRMYSSSGYVSSGSAISPAITPSSLQSWSTFVFDKTTPAGTTLTVDVLPATGSTPITGYSNVSSGVNLIGLNTITYPTIRLRANLSTTNTSVSPSLQDWTVSWISSVSNDNFANRINLGSVSSVATTGSNLGYTGETGELAQNSTINSAWWSWTAPSTGQLTVDTFGSEFDTFLTLATGSAVNALTPLVQNDDSNNTLQSSVTWSVVAGTQYQIAVDGYLDNTGSIALNLSFTQESVPVAPVITSEPIYTAGRINTIYWSSVSDATDYYLEWDNVSTFTDPDGSSGWITATNYPAFPLFDGQVYYFHVKARNANGQSPWSSYVYSTQDASPPSSSVNTLISLQTNSSFQVSWSRSDVTSGVAATHLYYSHEGGPYIDFGAGINDTYTTFDTSTTGGDGAYAFYTRATDNVGNVESAPGSPDQTVEVDTTAPTSSAGSLSASYNTAAINVPYTASDGIGTGVLFVNLWYRRRPLSGGTWGSWTQYGGSFTVSPISFNSSITGGNGEYEFYTLAIDGANHTEAAPVTADAATKIVVLSAPVMTPESPYTPTTANTVSWSPVPDADAYYVECDNNSDFSSPEFSSGWITGTSYTFNGLTRGITYNYHVQARTTIAGQVGSWSQTAQADFAGDVLTNSAATTINGDGKVVLASGTGGSRDVLWDLSHGVYSDYQPSQAFSNLVAQLDSSGYTVTTTNAYLTNVNLSSYEVIVINLASAWNSVYSAGEVAALQTFVQNGGGLIVQGDNMESCPNANVNPVAQAFGSTVGVSDLTPDVLYISNFTNHPIFNGVSQICYIAAGEVTATTPSGLVAFDPAGHGSVAVAQVGAGRVVVLGDAGFWDNEYLIKSDNSQFADNVFAWLTPGSSDVLSGATISTPITPPLLDHWGTLNFNKTTPAATTLTVDVLNASGDLLAANVSSGTNLADLGINVSTIKLRANLATSDSRVTPSLSDWTVAWQATPDSYMEGPWSNLVFSSQGTAKWDGGSLVDNHWSTPANWDGDVAPAAGDNLIFPAGADRMINLNDYPSPTVFGSITVSGSGYRFQCNSHQASTFELQPNTNVEINAIDTDTLTLGAGSVLTITPIASGPQAQSTINPLAVITNPSVNNIITDPISLVTSAPDQAMTPSPVVIDQPLPAETIDPAPATVVIDQSLPAGTIDLVSAPAPVVFEKLLRAEDIDLIPAPAPVVFEQPLPAKTLDLPPALVPVALNLPLSAQSVEIPSALESNSKIRDILFSQPEQEVLLPTALTNSLSNDTPGKSPASESGKLSNSLLAFDNVPRQKAFVPRSILSISSARDLALQQTLHDDWRQDWLRNDDLEKIKKRQKDDFNSTLSLAWASVLK